MDENQKVKEEIEDEKFTKRVIIGVAIFMVGYLMGRSSALKDFRKGRLNEIIFF